MGLLRQDLTGRCVSPTTCDEGVTLQAEDGWMGAVAVAAEDGTLVVVNGVNLG